MFRATCSHFKNDGKTLHSDHFESALSHTHSHQQHKYINAVIVAIVIISIRVAQRFHACKQWFHSVRFSFLLFCSKIFFHIFLPGSCCYLYSQRKCVDSSTLYLLIWWLRAIYEQKNIIKKKCIDTSGGSDDGGGGGGSSQWLLISLHSVWCDRWS